MEVSLRKGDPKAILEWMRRHKADPELADLIDAASAEFRKAMRPR